MFVGEAPGADEDIQGDAVRRPRRPAPDEDHRSDRAEARATSTSRTSSSAGRRRTAIPSRTKSRPASRSCSSRSTSSSRRSSSRSARSPRAALLRTLDPISRLRGRVFDYRGAKLDSDLPPRLPAAQSLVEAGGLGRHEAGSEAAQRSASLKLVTARRLEVSDYDSIRVDPRRGPGSRARPADLPRARRTWPRRSSARASSCRSARARSPASSSRRRDAPTGARRRGASSRSGRCSTTSRSCRRTSSSSPAGRPSTTRPAPARRSPPCCRRRRAASAPTRTRRSRVGVDHGGGPGRGAASVEAPTATVKQREALEIARRRRRTALPTAELAARGIGADTVARLGEARAGRACGRSASSAIRSRRRVRAAAPADAGRRLTAEQAARARRGCARCADAATFRVALLHGVTGSGKTEIYLRLSAAVRRVGPRAC